MRSDRGIYFFYLLLRFPLHPIGTGKKPSYLSRVRIIVDLSVKIARLPQLVHRARVFAARIGKH